MDCADTPKCTPRKASLANGSTHHGRVELKGELNSQPEYLCFTIYHGTILEKNQNTMGFIQILNLTKLSIGINVLLGLLLLYFLMFEGLPRHVSAWVFTVFVLILTMYNVFLRSRWFLTKIIRRLI